MYQPVEGDKTEEQPPSQPPSRFFTKFSGDLVKLYQSHDKAPSISPLEADAMQPQSKQPAPTKQSKQSDLVTVGAGMKTSVEDIRSVSLSQDDTSV